MPAAAQARGHEFGPQHPGKGGVRGHICNPRTSMTKNEG